MNLQEEKLLQSSSFLSKDLTVVGIFLIKGSPNLELTRKLNYF